MGKKEQGRGPDPAPIDPLRERRNLVDEAKAEIMDAMESIATNRKISTWEMLYILSSIIADLTHESMLLEHDEFFGPEAE